MSDAVVWILAFAIGWGLAAGLVLPVAAVCHRHGWLDQPGPRKLHPRPTPRLTGIVLFLAIWVPLLGAALFVPGRMAEFRLHAWPIFSGAVLMLAVGVVDDLRPLRGSVKLCAQLAVGLFLYLAGIGFDRLWIPFVGGIDLGLLSAPVTLFWFLVLVNAVNIIDGMDGLAVATTAVATLTLIWISWTLHLPAIWIGSAGLLGGLVAFWRYNRPPASVFMGDTGSLSLGYFFAIVALLAPIKRFTALAFFVPILALFVPLAESLISLGRRSLSGRNPFRADAGHLHHRLMEAGWSPRQILVAYTALAAIVGGFCVCFRYFNRRIVAAALGIFVLAILAGLGIILGQRVEGTGGQERIDEG